MRKLTPPHVMLAIAFTVGVISLVPTSNMSYTKASISEPQTLEVVSQDTESKFFSFVSNMIEKIGLKVTMVE